MAKTRPPLEFEPGTPVKLCFHDSFIYRATLHAMDMVGVAVVYDIDPPTRLTIVPWTSLRYLEIDTDEEDLQESGPDSSGPLGEPEA